MPAGSAVAPLVGSFAARTLAQPRPSAPALARMERTPAALIAGSAYT